MSLFFRKTEQRAITGLPWDIGGSRYDRAGQERALALTPVFAANRHITDLASTLPLKAYRKVGEERQPQPDLPKMFADLEADGMLIAWLSQAITSVVIRGNAVGLIASTDGFGLPTNVAWLSMDRVQVDDSSGVGIWYVDGRRVARRDLVHIPWITVPGKTLALSPIEYYAATIGLGLDTQEYGADWFRNGGIPPGKFKNTAQVITPEAAQTIGERLLSSMRAHRPLVYGSDWDYEPISIPPNQAQFIETQKLTANQVAAIYGINPVEVGGEPPNGLTYSNETDRHTMQRLANIRPYLTRFERAFASWLPDRDYVKFNADAIVRADILTRHQVYQIQRQIGLLSINEQRALEDLPPVAGGDSTAPLQVQQQPAVRELPAPETDPGDPESIPLRIVNP